MPGEVVDLLAKRLQRIAVPCRDFRRQLADLLSGAAQGPLQALELLDERLDALKQRIGLGKRERLRGLRIVYQFRFLIQDHALMGMVLYESVSVQ